MRKSQNLLSYQTTCRCQSLKFLRKVMKKKVLKKRKIKNNFIKVIKKKMMNKRRAKKISNKNLILNLQRKLLLKLQVLDNLKIKYLPLKKALKRLMES